ncbi:hypothetical protein IQ241_05115 [Romeria aff. gracilis LEGE 07310]|uniref:Uncharacterized protein n=1 Tax=Vasconcelosia minhoensis LEGE 07310 TaxID=915328 RepID=A0A8J7A5B4_9CYAN|nr:hypothetical protein [Romeria gracilis]MBE9076682.1 hypothetical protein [Romeria aff. gracilis LEGE 07310]
MNAAEQARSIEFASKIAAAVSLFKTRFPDLRADLKPWAGDPETQDLIDPESIDIGFHFPGVSRSFHCRSLLVQIRFHREIETEPPRVIGLEVAGFDHHGQQWQLSTIGTWHYEGEAVPETPLSQALKDCCRQVLELFNRSC